MSKDTQRRLSLAAMLAFTLVVEFFISRRHAIHLTEPLQYLLFVLAAALGGPAIAYLQIGEPIRHPLTRTEEHASGLGGGVVEPKYDGYLEGPGILVSCPICSATWVGLGLLLVNAFDHNYALTVAVTLAVGGTARPVFRLAELFEAVTDYHRYKSAEVYFRLHPEKLKPTTMIHDDEVAVVGQDSLVFGMNEHTVIQ